MHSPDVPGQVGLPRVHYRFSVSGVDFLAPEKSLPVSGFIKTSIRNVARH